MGANLAAPHVLGTKQFLLVGVALIGTTITPYMQFYMPAAVADLISIFIMVATARPGTCGRATGRIAR